MDISGQVDNRVPIDASGAFEFLFDTYRYVLLGGKDLYLPFRIAHEYNLVILKLTAIKR